MIGAHTGGDAAQSADAFGSSMFYAITYVLTTLGTFGMIQFLARKGFEAEEIDDFKGLARRSPWLAGVMMMMMFSLAGLPPLVGFYAKLVVLESVIAIGLVWLAVYAVVMSLIGAYYYIRVIKVMYFDEPVDTVADRRRRRRAGDHGRQRTADPAAGHRAGTAGQPCAPRRSARPCRSADPMAGKKSPAKRTPGRDGVAETHDLAETTLEQRIVFEGKFLKVRRDLARLPDGSTATREFVVHPGAAAMVPIGADERILVERQYRYAMGAMYVEIPAGKIDAGETSLQTAKRELLEETGYEAEQWAFLTRVHPAIGFSDEVMDLYLARDLVLRERSMDVGRVPRDRVGDAGLDDGRVARGPPAGRQDPDRRALARPPVSPARGPGRRSTASARTHAVTSLRNRAATQGDSLPQVPPVQVSAWAGPARRLEHLLHGDPEDRRPAAALPTRWRTPPPRGTIRTGSAAPNSTSTGQPTAAAECAGPVSTEIMALARDCRASSRGIGRSQARLNDVAASASGDDLLVEIVFLRHAQHQDRRLRMHWASARRTAAQRVSGHHLVLLGRRRSPRRIVRLFPGWTSSS